MTPAQSNDLRERMQRVASKPRRRSTAAARRPVVVELPADGESALARADDEIAVKTPANAASKEIPVKTPVSATFEELPVREPKAKAARTAVSRSDEVHVTEMNRPRRHTPRRTAATSGESGPAPGTSRQQTLVEWARWELMAVPMQRLDWLKKVLRG